MVAEFKRRRDYLVPALNGIEGVRCATPLGAFYVFPNVDGICGNLGIHDFYERLSPERKRKTSPSTLFMRFLLLPWGRDRRPQELRSSRARDSISADLLRDRHAVHREGVARIRKERGTATGSASSSRTRSAGV
jgi:hypothetical protein